MKLEIEGSLTLEEIRELRKVLIWLRRKRKKQDAKFTYKLENSQPQGTAGEEIRKAPNLWENQGLSISSASISS